MTEEKALQLVAQFAGPQKLQDVLNALEAAEDGLERFAMLLQLGITPMSAKEVLIALRYQVAKSYVRKAGSA